MLYLFNKKKRYAAGLKKRATKAEKRLYVLRLFGFKFQGVCYGTIPDYYNKWLKFAVEVDGSVHRGKRKHTDRMRDNQRRYWGVYTLRVSNWETHLAPLVLIDVLIYAIVWRAAKLLPLNRNR